MGKRNHKPRLYNLTLHRQVELADRLADKWDVEIQPRLRPVMNPQDWRELKKVVEDAVYDIPEGASVLIGGMTQLSSLIIELEMFVPYYVKLQRDEEGARNVPVSIDCHQTWTREELHKIKVVNKTRMEERREVV